MNHTLSRSTLRFTPTTGEIIPIERRGKKLLTIGYFLRLIFFGAFTGSLTEDISAGVSAATCARLLARRLRRSHQSRAQVCSRPNAAEVNQYSCMLCKTVSNRDSYEVFRLTPGTRSAIRIRPTDAIRSEAWNIFFGSMTVSPAARRFAVHSATCCSRARASAVVNHREASTFAKVVTPSRMGRVPVGSPCDRDVRVRKDSESKTVGGADARPSTIESPTKRGSWVTGGMSIVGRTEEPCSLASSFCRAFICRRCMSTSSPGSDALNVPTAAPVLHAPS